MAKKKRKQRESKRLVEIEHVRGTIGYLIERLEGMKKKLDDVERYVDDGHAELRGMASLDVADAKIDAADICLSKSLVDLRRNDP